MKARCMDCGAQLEGAQHSCPVCAGRLRLSVESSSEFTDPMLTSGSGPHAVEPFGGMNIFQPELIARFSPVHGVPFIRLRDFEIAPEVIALIPLELAQVHTLVPLNRAEGSLMVALADPGDRDAIESIRAHTGLRVEPVMADGDAILAAHQRYYRSGGQTDRE